MSTQNGPSFKTKVRGLLLLIGGCVLSCLLIDYVDSPILASCMFTGVVGWFLSRWVGLNFWGVLFWCSALVLSYAMSWEKATTALHGTANTQVLLAVEMLCVGASMVCFFVASMRNQKKRKRNVIGVVLAILVLISFAGKTTGTPRQNAYLEAVRKTTQTLIGFHQLGNEVEALRAKLGRLPNNEEEFVRLRGEAMPVYSGTHCYHYSHADGTHYQISCCMNCIWGIGFDLLGYHVCYYGPASTERIYSEP